MSAPTPMTQEPPAAELQLSPLDQIRQCEADVTGRIAAARQAADERVVKARAEAARLKKQARENGTQRGRAEYQEIVSKAEEQAQVLVAEAHKKAEELLQHGYQRSPQAVRMAVNILLGIEEDVPGDEH